MSSPHPKAVEALFRVLIGSPGVSLPYLRFVMLRLAGFNITPRGQDRPSPAAGTTMLLPNCRRPKALYRTYPKLPD